MTGVFSGGHMQRREFITLIGGAAAAWPLAAQAQQAERVWRVGVLAGFTQAEGVPLVEAFRDRLKELGWTEGRNLTIDARFTSGNFKALDRKSTRLNSSH